MDTLDQTVYTLLLDFARQRRYAVKMPNAPVIWAYSYLRFSTPEQAKGGSIRRQTDLLNAWLARNPKVKLDKSLTFKDAGVSGFSGKHRTDPKYGLASFLDCVERGVVPVGSYLIVENLDRLTRENPINAIPAVLALIKAGIRIVQLAPYEMVYDGEMEQHELFLMLSELARGHGESKRKSGMLSNAWESKHREAAEGKPHGKSVPAWLELTEEGYRVRLEARAAIRSIFLWSAEGMGTFAITRRLNAEGYSPIGKADKWVRSYVAKTLRNRATIGEFQPRDSKKGRVPRGEPIPNYFPAVVTEAEFYAAQAGRKERDRRCGRPIADKEFSFPFSGLLRCAIHRSKVHVIKRVGRRYLVPAPAAEQETGARWLPFCLTTFRDALLSQMEELQASDLFSHPASAKLAELEGRIADTERRLKAAVAAFESDPESPTWSAKVSEYDKEKRRLVASLTEARAEAETPLPSIWAHAVACIRDKEPERLRAALLQTVDEVWCVFGKCGFNRIAVAQVFFKEGASRVYAVYWKRAVTLPGHEKPEGWYVRSLPCGPDDRAIDLRKVADAKRVERWIASQKV